MLTVRMIFISGVHFSFLMFISHFYDFMYEIAFNVICLAGMDIFVFFRSYALRKVRQFFFTPTATSIDSEIISYLMHVLRASAYL